MLKFGVLGAANITPRALVYPCMDEGRASIHVIGARDSNRANTFAKAHHIPNVAGSYQDVISFDEINAVYNPLPITRHHEWSIKALEAGKHVLCEKSFASNEQEALEMQAAADKAGLVLMDAFHYRYHPCFLRAKEIYASGVLGDIESITAEFSVADTPPADDIRMIYEMGGGVTMDIGCYPISWVRHLTGLEPKVTGAEATTGPDQVDLYLKADMEFAGGIKATTIGDMRDGGQFKAYIFVKGSLGTLMVRNPLIPQMGHSLELDIGDSKVKESMDRRPTYGYQLDAFLEAIDTGDEPLTGPADAVLQMRTIDHCYRAAGLKPRGT